MRSPSELIASNARGEASPSTFTAWHSDSNSPTYTSTVARASEACSGSFTNSSSALKCLARKSCATVLKVFASPSAAVCAPLSSSIGHAAHRRSDDDHARSGLLARAHNFRRRTDRVRAADRGAAELHDECAHVFLRTIAESCRCAPPTLCVGQGVGRFSATQHLRPTGNVAYRARDSSLRSE